MKKYILKLLLFLLPFIIIISSVAYIDFFKIWGFRNDYYKNYVVELNREMICTKTYDNLRKSKKFNSFIFGSSRSLAFKCVNWKKYLEKGSVPFHFDASGERIIGISKKIQYIDEMGDTIKNALVILDIKTLSKVKLEKGHLFISMPQVSNSSYFEYYFTFLKASFNPKFIFAYVDYSLSGQYKDYMKYSINHYAYDPVANYETGDLWVGSYEHIKRDSIGYYKKMIKKGVFYKRPKSTSVKYTPVKIEEISNLKIIKKVFSKHKTKYKIVISPAYDQIPLGREHLQLLHDLFGKENVYDFSGKNSYTDKISNYYEQTHYRPIVGNDIMRIIYGGS